MTEIMPVPRNLILLSYQQGASGSRFFCVLYGVRCTPKTYNLGGVHIGPAECTDFTKIFGEFVTSQTGRQRRRHLRRASILPISRRGGRLCPPAGCTGFPGNPRRIRSCPPGGAQPCSLPAAFASRVYLKTHDVTGSEGFLRCARHFFAGILTYFKEK